MVRAWSGECDTLYVVTGVVPSESRFIVDRGGNRVNVPEGFYKALLKGNVEKDDKGNPSGMKYTSAIAFYFKNESQPSSKVSASMAMSVAALESKVQMNFFINLPAQYQNIEKVCSPSDWGLK
jgi:DNA/RNA endonuclease G (NUC1)